MRKRANELRAWNVSDADYESSTVVFATSESMAKRLAQPDLDTEWTNLRVRREPRLDGFATEEKAIEWSAQSPELMCALRNIGWRPTEGCRLCDFCGLAEWPEIPESRLLIVADGDRMCVGCYEARAKESSK